MRLESEVEDDDTTVQISPLIDCVFLLLIFFIILALMKPRHNEISFKMSIAGTTMPVSDEIQKRLSLRLSGGSYSFYEDRVLMETVPHDRLVEKLSELISANPNRVIFVEPNVRTKMYELAPVLDALEKVNWRRVDTRTVIEGF